MGKALIEAAKKGNLEEINKLLQEPNLNINAYDKDGCTALHKAIEQGHTLIVQALITAMADVNAVNKGGSTPLHWASIGGHTPIVQALITAKADVNVVESHGCTALRWAAELGHTLIVQALINAKADVNAADKEGCSALHWAAHEGHTPIVQILVAAKADVNAANKEGRTALYWATLKRHTSIVQALITAKADVNMADNEGHTALQEAAFIGHASIVQVLIAAKADVNVVDPNGWTALYWAARQGQIHIIQTLIIAKADVNVASKKGYTALHVAVEHGHTPIVQALITAKADVNAANKKGYTALYVAALYQIQNPNQVPKTGVTIIEALLNAGAFIDTPMPDFPKKNLILNIFAPYKTAIEQLFIAASNLKTTQEDIDSILSKLGAGLNGRLQNNNNTALHVAIEKNLSLALELIVKGASVDVLGNNKLSVRDILNQLYTQKPNLIIKLCLAYMKLRDLKNMVHPYTQETNDTSHATVVPAADSAIAPKDSKSALDNAPLFHSRSATAAAETAVPATIAGGATTSAGASSSSFETVKLNSALELQLLEIYNLIMEDKSRSLEDDKDNLDLKENPESDDIEDYLESKKQSLYFELGAFIVDHPALFPNALGIAERLLDNIKQNHPHFQMANARLVELGMQVMKQPSAQNNTATIKRIKRLLYAGKASPHYDTVGDLMADVLGHGLENQALRGFKANHADLVFTLFNSLNDQYTLGKAAQKNTQEALAREKNALAREQKALSDKQDALAREQNAMNEITRLRLLLSSNGVNSKTETDKAIKETNPSTMMILSGAKIKGQNDSSSTVLISTAAALEASHPVAPNSASSTTATSVGTLPYSLTSYKPEDGVSTKQAKLSHSFV